MDKATKLIILIACLLLIMAFIIVLAMISMRSGEDNILKAVANVLFESVQVYR